MDNTYTFSKKIDILNSITLSFTDAEVLKHVVEHLLRSDGSARDVGQGVQAGTEMLTEQVAAQPVFHAPHDEGEGFMGPDEGHSA